MKKRNLLRMLEIPGVIILGLGIFAIPYINEARKASKHEEIARILSNPECVKEIPLNKGEGYWNHVFNAQEDLKNRGIKIDPTIIHEHIKNKNKGKEPYKIIPIYSKERCEN